MRRWIGLPRVAGEASRQAHADLPSGGFERELGREGFYGPATQMVHAHPPVAWREVEGELRPRAFDLARLEAAGEGPWGATPVLGNAHLRLRLWRCERPMHELARNADGDELVFVHRGGADLYCDYGHLAVREGDYLLLPRGTLWRVAPIEPLALLLIEATGEALGLPERGLLGRHAIFDPAVLDVPALDEAFRAQRSEEPVTVVVRRGARFTRIHYPFNPLDALGWHGDLTPVRLNWRDLRPVTSHRYHLPPSVHTTFVAPRFVVCTFTPRPIETDPGALKVPFFHSNDDYDEVIFYHRGEFFSRDDIHPGMLTLHPCGVPHGPHPKALAAGARHARRETDEVAVMVDARDPLEVEPTVESVEWREYVHSWRGYLE